MYTVYNVCSIIWSVYRGTPTTCVSVVVSCTVGNEITCFAV